MAIEYIDDKIVFSGRVFENELLPLKEYLDSQKKPLTMDLTKCSDMHGGVIQLLLAYKSIFSCDFIFADSSSTYKKALEGFRTVENDCNK